MRTLIRLYEDYTGNTFVGDSKDGAGWDFLEFRALLYALDEIAGLKDMINKEPNND